MMGLRSSIAFMLVSAVLAGACLDLSPLPYEGPEGGLPLVDGSIPDVVFDVSADGPGSACPQCLKTGCRSEDTACEENAKCSKFAACMSATRCWGSSLTDLTKLSPCILQCGASAGIVSQVEPASVLISPLLTCAQDPTTCASACVVGTE